jgi:hypothetical protein
MSRKELFAIGAIMVAAALGGLLSSQKIISVILLIVGSLLIGIPYPQDWRFGAFRPSKEEIDRMPAKEYRDAIKRKKFRKYVEHVFKNSGRYQIKED